MSHNYEYIFIFLKPSGTSSHQTKKTKRGLTKKLEGRFFITEVALASEPIAPKVATKKYVRQCGCLVRDHIPISVRLWIANNPSEQRDAVPEREKEWLWRELK